MHDKSGVGATVTKDARSSAWGWQRTQRHQENGYSLTENCLSYIIKEGEFTLNFFPARRGFHCISLTAKMNAPGIPSWGWGGNQMIDALHAVLFPREIQLYAHCQLQVSFWPCLLGAKKRCFSATYVLKGAMSPLAHARANENKLEKVNPTFSSSVGDFGRPFFIWDDLPENLVKITPQDCKIATSTLRRSKKALFKLPLLF